MTEPPPEDFIDAVKADEAAERARQAAIAPPPRPERRTNRSKLDSYVETAIRDETAAVASARSPSEGGRGRNDALNTAAFNLGTLVGAGVLDRARAEDALYRAAVDCGHVRDDGERMARGTIRSGLDGGARSPRDMSDVGQVRVEGRAEQAQIGSGRIPAETPAAQIRNTSASTGRAASPTTGQAADDDAKILKLRKLSTVRSRVPMWVWEHDGKGRIQLGTMSMFAGKPSAGKSTAVRWFAARISRGELPGAWYGHPMRVAVVMAEEQTDAVVVPGLVAADADLANVFTPEIRVGGIESGFTTSDMGELQEELLDMGVRAVFVDPIMSTFGGKADVYRNNEVREKLAPFTRMAEAINGVVVGVTHLTKGQIRDVLGGMNGSAAFGEVPRAVFGFAPIEDGNHVLEQVKNSAGVVGMRLSYRLPISYMTADDGQPIDLPRFEITGETEVSIADINPSSDETTDISVAREWLNLYLLENQPAPSATVKRDAKQHGDIQPWTLKRAMKELRVRVTSRSEPGKPHTTVWSLPDLSDGDP